VQPKIKVWVVFSPRTKFGQGRAELLELIDRLGSINKAVAQIGMSYRTAWGYIRELEKAAGFHLVERTPGRGVRGGTRLTPRGRRFLERYRSFHHGLERSVSQQFTKAFGRRRAPAAGRKPRLTA
jgi:molybdate transport system regulatory protein